MKMLLNGNENGIGMWRYIIEREEYSSLVEVIKLIEWE